MQVLLQETAWTESSVPLQKEARNIALSTVQRSCATTQEPIFCWETVMKVHPTPHWPVCVLSFP